MTTAQPRGLVYLASPYNHSDAAVREKRFQDVCRVASALMRDGVYLFCPIAHTHPIAESGDLPKGWDYWKCYDELMLAACSELWVVMLDGWRESIGVAADIGIAQKRGMPVIYLEEPKPEGWDKTTAQFTREQRP